MKPVLTAETPISARSFFPGEIQCWRVLKELVPEVTLYVFRRLWLSSVDRKARKFALIVRTFSADWLKLLYTPLRYRNNHKLFVCIADMLYRSRFPRFVCVNCLFVNIVLHTSILTFDRNKICCVVCLVSGKQWLYYLFTIIQSCTL